MNSDADYKIKEVRHLLDSKQFKEADVFVQMLEDGWLCYVLKADICIAKMNEASIPRKNIPSYSEKARTLCMRAWLSLYNDSGQESVDKYLSKIKSQLRDILKTERICCALGVERLKEDEVIQKFYIDRPDIQRCSLGEQSLKARDRLKGGLWPLRTIDSSEYFLKFLKIYSSYTPLVSSDNVAQHGGGYFACFGGYGCVIDPGHHFLDNFFRYGHSIHDIDCVVITHFHDDHYADFLALLSLLHQRSKLVKTKDGNRKQSSDEVHKPGRRLRKKVDFFLDATSYEMFASLLCPNKGGVRKVRFCRRFEKLSPDGPIISLAKGITMRPICTQHNVLGRNSGVGLLFMIPRRKTSVLITGDTAWKGCMPEAYRELASSIGNKNCVVVAHVSTAYEKEVIGGFYNNHLAIRGLCRVIAAMRPKQVILSEIGEELRDSISGLKDIIKTVYGCKCYVGWIEQDYSETKRDKPFTYNF